MFSRKIAFLFFIACNISASCAFASPAIYLFLDSGPATKYQHFLNHPNIKGAQIIYSWKILEPKKDVYDFKSIEQDLKIMTTQDKLLFIQIQDKSFSPHVINVPNYLLSNAYNGGIAQQSDFSGEGKPKTTGWVAKQWEPAVQERFQKLLMNLGKHFDGKIAGINLTETSIDLNEKNLPPTFTCDHYFQSIVDNVTVLRSAFHKSAVVQYVNYFPCEWDNDHHYMSKLFDYAATHNIGLGNPDTVPNRRGQMKNSYPYFHKYKEKLPLIAFAVQEPDYSYHNPKSGKNFTANEIYDFANNYLGATVIFWNIQQPQFTQQVIPLLNRIEVKS